MLCQNCGQREADKTFIANWMGTQYEVHICEKCLEQMWQFAKMTGQKDAFTSFTGWWPGKETPRETGSDPFPADMKEHIKRNMRLSSLRARMEDASEQENYEEAARLRDRIAAIEQEEVTHEP
ncbi:MAG: UvrB/UvrC motif-containing protein [Christensenellaceae bacterium]|jgi:protein-arginine kinase activator protein McsA